MKFRTILLGLAALFVAVNAAYFSVLGLSKLFAGASMSVIIMASSLEAAKLIAASFLYNYWGKVNKFLRGYLMVGVLVLILITSAGIYGFLTSAYQTTSDQLTMLDKRVELVETKKDRYQVQYDEYSVEKKSLQITILELTKGLSNNVIQYRDKESGEIITTTSSNTRRTLTTQLNENKEQRNKISEKMEVLSDSITSLDIQALEIRATDEVAGEVGPLKYLAQITGQPMDKIVNWFALFIIFVFDPLAVTLIVAFNVAMKVDRGIVDKEKVIRRRKIYGEEEDIEWDGFYEEPHSVEQPQDAKDLVKKVEDQKAWNRLFGDEEIEPNDKLKEAARKFEESIDEHKKEEQKQHIIDMMKSDEELGLYDSGSWEQSGSVEFNHTTKEVRLIENWKDEDEDAEGLPPIQSESYKKALEETPDEIIEEVKKKIEEINKNDFTCYEIHRPNIPDNGCEIQCKECKEKEIGDIELVDEEIIVPMDKNKDGIITPDEQREYYETTGWKNAYQNKPYYHHPWFDWNIIERWKNDSHAVGYWKKYRGGTQQQLDDMNNKYPTDFSSKTY